MSKTKWTNEQLSAIDTRNCNLLVAAAAGSGKTAVLVERIIKIITNEEQPVDIDKLLVVTFTNAAAAEMRERIASAISKELDKTPNSKNLQKQLTLLNRSNITTMHSFCLDVIKNNFHKIDLDPSFRIGDQTECTLIKDEVMEELFEKKYDEEDQEFIDLVEAFSNYKNDENLKNLVMDLYNFTMSGPWPEKWLEYSSEEFNVKSLEELNSSRWVSILSDSIKVELEGYVRMMERALNIVKYTDGLDAYIPNFEEELMEMKDAYSNIDNGLDSMYKSLVGIKFGRLKSVKKDAVLDKEAQDIVKKIRDDIKKKISDLISTTFAITPEEMLVNIQGAYPYMKKLSEVVLEFGSLFSKKKKDKNILDFNDLEHLCLKILSDHDEEGNMIPSSVAENFKNYFDEVLVDEYQDSNNIQETIINLVSRKETDIPNVFMVGDVKQSIYRFRQAKPELFIDKYNTYEIGNGLNRKIQLYKNFRSRKEILDSVNFIFKELMSETVGELEYTDDEALNLGADYKTIDDDNSITGGPIEVNIINKTNEIVSRDDEDMQDEEELDNANLEARVIADRINQLMSAKDGKVFKVLDKETGEYRALRYKDIVILLRATKNWSETIVDELGEYGIPVYADTGSGYFEAIEIRTIMSLLKIIDNPMQDVPMLSVLRSPIMGFTAEELSDVRLADKEKYFYENIKFISDEEKYPVQFREKCKYVLKCIEKWRNKSIYMPIDEFIWYLYMDTAYYGYVGAMPNGMLRQANLKILFQRAKQFEQTSFKGLFNFINFINKVTKSSGDMGSAKILGENEDVVRIMSIHKSKGLEFPVVFLCGTGKHFNLMDLNKSVLYHDELGLGPDYIDLDKRFSISTLAKDAIKKKMKLETLSEEMRILYVACTRAKEKLIVTGTTRNIQNSIDKWITAASLDRNVILPSEVLKGKCYLDWIGMSLCQHKDGRVLREYVGVPDEIAKDDASKWQIKLWNKSEFINKQKNDEEDNEELELSILDNEKPKKINEEIKSRLEYTYPLIKVTKIKSNISVSELKRKAQEENFDVEEMFTEKNKITITPKFLQEEKGLSAAERGTALHFVMRKLDLNKVSSIAEIKIQLQELYDNEFLSEEEFNSVNVYKILKFFRSDLGQKMIEASNNNKLYREISFYTEIKSTEVYSELDKKYDNEKIRLQGIIDCFFEYGNELILLDYKTDYVPEGKEDELKDKYTKQLDYYSNAIFKMTGKKVSKRYLYSFFLEKEIEVI